MKLLLLFSGLILSVSLAAQYPSGGIKSRLGYQTTGDGLIYRGAGAPSYSPGTMFNAWMYLDTTNYTLYMYKNFQWTKLPLVNNGLNLDGAYVQLGGTLVENTQVERSTYTLDFGKISGTNFGYASFYGTDPHYFGVLTKKDGVESGLTIGNKTFGFEVDDASDVFSLSGRKTGFDATYLGSLGVSQFKMDSTKFFLRGPVSYSSHTVADANVADYQLYRIDNSRALYVKNSAVTSQDILGAGTATRIPIWSNSRLLGDSPILYNSTTKRTTWDSPGVIELPMGTDAQRPSPATTSDFWYNTTSNGLEWYQGSRWAKALESTFNRGTATRIPYFDANGQITDNANMLADISNNRYYFAGSGNTGTSTLTSSTGLRLELRATDNTGNTGGYIAFGSQFGIGAAIKYRHSSGAGLTTGGIDFFTRAAVGDATLTRQMQLDLNGLLTVEGSAILKGDVTMGRVRINNFNAGGPGIYGNITEGILSTGVYQNSQAAIKLDFLSGNYDFQTAPVGTVNTTPTLTSRMYLTNTGLLRLGGTGTTNYQLDVQGSNAIGLPRGTVAQRPTIVSSTTPFRYNTDSTALEYGESVGTWRQIATRAYARSLVSSLPTTNIYTSDGTLSGNRTVTGGNNSLAFDGVSKLTINSNRYNFGEAGIYTKNVDTTASNYWGDLYRGVQSNNGFFFRDSLKNSSSGVGYILNHKYNNLRHSFGAEYFSTNNMSVFNIAQITPTARNSIYNQIAYSIKKTGNQNRSDNFLLLSGQGNNGRLDTSLVMSFSNLFWGDTTGVRTSAGAQAMQTFASKSTWSAGANIIIDPIGTQTSVYPSGESSKSLTISKTASGGIGFTAFYMPFSGQPRDGSSYSHYVIIGEIGQFSKSNAKLIGYGTGIKEAADLSKTQSNYIAGFATDGTVLDLEHKRDTTVYVTDTDLDWSAAITTAQISRRYNRVIFLMTTTAAAGSDSDLTLHTPDVNLMQVEYLIRSTDEAGGFSNKIVFGSNNAVDSTNGLVTNYFPSAGQGVGIRAGLRSGVYKYYYY